MKQDLQILHDKLVTVNAFLSKGRPEYQDDQARGEDGRWTSGGGGNAAAGMAARIKSAKSSLERTKTAKTKSGRVKAAKQFSREAKGIDKEVKRRYSLFPEGMPPVARAGLANLISFGLQELGRVLVSAGPAGQVASVPVWIAFGVASLVAAFETFNAWHDPWGTKTKPKPKGPRKPRERKKWGGSSTICFGADGARASLVSEGWVNGDAG